MEVVDVVATPKAASAAAARQRPRPRPTKEKEKEKEGEAPPSVPAPKRRAASSHKNKKTPSRQMADALSCQAPAPGASRESEAAENAGGNDNETEDASVSEIENPRNDTVSYLSKNLSEIQARDAEIGAYNWALREADERHVPKSWANERFRSLYLAKARSVAANLDPQSYVCNAHLAARLMEGEFLPHDISSMRPENVFPERWRDVVEMKVRQIGRASCRERVSSPV